MTTRRSGGPSNNASQSTRRDEQQKIRFNVLWYFGNDGLSLGVENLALDRQHD